MERIQSINPERIRWCCADHGITLSKLASELGLSENSLQSVMDGSEGLTFHQLQKLADYFGRGILFFLEKEPVNDEQLHTAQFRTLANQKPQLSPKLKAFIERVEKQRDIYLSLLEDIDDAEYPRFSPPALPAHNITEAARITRSWLGLSESNSFDTYREAVEAQGILVFRSNGYAGKWQIAKESPIIGFTMYDNICPVIVVKKQDWDTMQSFTLMHELGHLLLHKASSVDDESDLHSHQGHEREANAFAGHVLVPEQFLIHIKDVDRPVDVSVYDAWLAPHRKAWGVSAEVILRRLLDVGRLPQSAYTEYRQWRSQTPLPKKGRGDRSYRHREPIHIFGDTFVRTVFDALNTRHITLAKASSYLDGLKIEDVHKLERHFAGL